MKMLTFLKTFLFIVLTSCSLAPMNMNTSGKSYGAGKIQTEVGNVNSTYHLKFGLGVTENFDFGFSMEFGAISTSALYAKYSFIQNETGLSVASDFGYGSTDATSFYYAGVISSLAFSKEFELFVAARLNSVSTDEAEIEKDKFHGNIKILEYDVTYAQLAYGMNIWFSETTGLALYSIHFTGEDIETSQDATFGASLMQKY